MNIDGMIDKHKLLSTVSATSNISSSLSSGDMIAFDDGENDLLTFDGEKTQNNENDSLRKQDERGPGDDSNDTAEASDKNISKKRPLQRFFSIRRNVTADNTKKNEDIIEKQNKDECNESKSVDDANDGELLDPNTEKQKRRSFFNRIQVTQVEDDEVAVNNQDGEELLIDFGGSENDNTQTLGSFRGLFMRIKKSKNEDIRDVKDEIEKEEESSSHEGGDSSDEEEEEEADDDNNEEESSDDEEEASNDSGLNKSSQEYSSEDDLSESETKAIIREKNYKAPLTTESRPGYFTKFSPRLNSNNTKTFQQNPSLPENNNQNRALHVKRLGDGVSQYLPQKVFHQQEQKKQQTKTYSNSITGFGSDNQRQEITFTLDHPSDPDRMEPYHSGNLVGGNTNLIDEMDLNMMESENNQNIFVRLGNKLNNFFEQHPEIIEFIDGPEGEDNKGFYRHVQVPTDDDSCPKEPSAEERILKELRNWKMKAITSKVRVEELERELAQNQEQVILLQEKLDKVNAQSNFEKVLENSTTAVTKTPKDLINLKNHEKEKDLIILKDEEKPVQSKDLIVFENSTTPKGSIISVDEDLIRLNSDGEKIVTQSGNLIDLKDPITCNIPTDVLIQFNDHTTANENNIDNDNFSSNKGNSGGESDINHAVNSDLSSDDVRRYSRQLLMSEGFGVLGQKKLLASSVLVVGAGGIGSTVLPYLAAAGIGSITIVDHDEVDASNLHRQIIHKESSVSMNKAVSACRALKALNSGIKCTPVEDYFKASNALDLVKNHDVVVDATDNPKTRYLINDACVLSGSTPLVSGSAMGTEGQLSVYNYGEKKCCYRCLYPKINPTEGCKSCSDNGVLGPVPGLIGILQSVEVLKILTGIGSTMHDRLIMYDSLNCSFLNIKKPPPRKSSCPVCGPHPSITSMEESLQSTNSARGPDGVPISEIQSSLPTMVPDLASNLTISCIDFDALRKSNKTTHILLDVRVRRQYEICAMEDSINIPLVELESRMGELKNLSDGWNQQVYCICRRGIASAEATRMINEHIASEEGKDHKSAHNVRGGLNAWYTEVDPDIPMY